ncbi:MAG: TlpA family protein disulfide reductase [Sandaracinaceae bacterium]
MRAVYLASALALGACGGGETSTGRDDGPAIGRSDDTSGDEGMGVPPVEGSIELSLRRADGTFLEVGDLRGRRVLLVLIATFDGTSQMLLHPLREFAEAHPDVTLVGVDVEPSARLLVGAYEQALEPPFPLGYDPEELVLAGTSTLGEILEVPTLIALDERGVELQRISGFQRADAIAALFGE